MDQNNKLEFVATCLFGLESLLGEEIEALGYQKTETIDGRVTFVGDEAAIARCNINLRFAERLYIRMGSFPAKTFAELFDGTNSLPVGEMDRSGRRFPGQGAQHKVRADINTGLPVYRQESDRQPPLRRVRDKVVQGRGREVSDRVLHTPRYRDTHD